VDFFTSGGEIKNIVHYYIYKKLDLTVFIPRCTMHVRDFIEGSKLIITNLVAWDLSDEQATANICIRDFMKVAVDVRQTKRINGKTGLVCPKENDFKMAKNFEFYALNLELPINYRAFKTMNQALEWFGIKYLTGLQTGS